MSLRGVALRATPRNDMKLLWRLIHGHITLLKNRSEEAIELIFVYSVRGTLETTDKNITNAVTIEDILCGDPIVACI